MLLSIWQNKYNIYVLVQCIVEFVFNNHHMDKGSRKTIDCLFKIGKYILSVPVHNDSHITVFWKVINIYKT
jgi:hypothetical protein